MPLVRSSATALVLLSLATPGVAAAADATPQNDLLNATLWMQKSVEYKAAALGIFALAHLRLDEALADPTWNAVDGSSVDTTSGASDRPTAIVTDLDETVLDNNVYEASLVTRGTNFSGKEWTRYVNDEKTGAVPGAVDFLRYASAKGVKIFYVSNRTKEEEPATRANMTALGFPMGGNVDTILSKGEKPEWTSDKSTRIAAVARDYRVLLLMGDNLGDFTDKADGPPDERLAAYKQAMAHWGKDWIVLPNPEYGSWESTSFGNKWSLPADTRRKMKIDRLDAWQPGQ